MLFSKALAQVTTGVYRVLAQTRVNKARLPSTPCHEQAICSANVVINGYRTAVDGRRAATRRSPPPATETPFRPASSKATQRI